MQENKDKAQGGWGKECEFSTLYEDDNYYLLIWDDPNAMEIRTTAQVREALEASLKEDESPWSMHNKTRGASSRDIDELMDWLNQEQDTAERVPSENFICDECGYVWIRRILPKCPTE